MSRAFLALSHDLRNAGARDGEYVLFGSSVLLLHGIREEVGDVDVFVARPVWRTLRLDSLWDVRTPDPDDPPFLERTAGTPVPIHAFYGWRAADRWMDVERCFDLAEVVRGWPCIPLAEVRQHKHEAWLNSRDAATHRKHLADVRAIDEHLRRAA